MSDIVQLKNDLRAAIDNANPDGSYSEDAIDTVHDLIQQLIPHSPIPSPLDEQGKVASPWGTLFAQFGAKHTAGKPVEHDTSFKMITFGKMPDRPMRMLDIQQEIHHESKDYNNVQTVESPDGKLKAHLIMFGRYDIEAEYPKRYMVEFYRVLLRGVNGESDADVRAAFGFDEDQPLDLEFKPPSFHSDVVYCDDDMRINLGSLGGAYVMERLGHNGHSVSFA